MPIMQNEVISDEAAYALCRALGYPRTARRRVLYFMRSIDCRVSRAHVNRLAELAPALAELDAEVDVIAPGEPRTEQPAWTGSLPFPVLFSNELFQVADLGRVLATVRRSGTLVIDADKSVLLVRRSVLPFKSFCEEELLASLGRERVLVPARTQVA